MRVGEGGGIRTAHTGLKLQTHNYDVAMMAMTGNGGQCLLYEVLWLAVADCGARLVTVLSGGMGKEFPQSGSGTQLVFCQSVTLHRPKAD